MSKKLAIKGHSTRGNEVIEILKMLGGKNNYDSPADNLGLCYLINDEFDICAHYFGYDDYEDGKLKIFTLEKFLKENPFKVGDKVKDCYGNPVTIKSMKWSEDFETMVYDFVETEDVLCAEDIESVNDIYTKPSKMKIVLAELLEHIKTTPKEELEREFEEIEEWSNVGPTVEEFRKFCECVNKKPKFPKTFEECLNMLYCKSILRTIVGHKAELLFNLEKLLICRDAYWKILGEEMGLGKSWEPEYVALEDNTYFTIQTFNGEIDKSATSHRNAILAFPTIEMRDAFYENFKDLIENCKELL